VILVDYSAIAISSVLAQKAAVDEHLIRHIILNSLRGHRAKHVSKYGELVICCDAGNNWRRKYFPEYKHKRATDRDDSKFDWDALFEIIEKVLQELRDYFPYKVVRVDGCEADDIIAQLCYQTQEFGQYEPVLIISGDKDFAQLQYMDNVDQYSPVLKKWIKEENPRAFLEEHILRGDKGDGVPNALSANNVFVEDIRQTPLRKAALEQLLDDPKSMGDTIYAHVMRNKLMIDLTQTPNQLKAEIIDTYNNNQPQESKSDILNYLIKYKCARLIEVAADFTRT
jgi:hypothetical protein